MRSSQSSPFSLIVKLLIIVAAIAAAYWAYGRFMGAGGTEQQQAGGGPGGGGFAMPVEAARLAPEPLAVTVSTVGSLRSNESVVLRPEVAGRIEKIMFEEGAPVKKGEVLVQLDDRQARAEVQQAEAQLRLARVSQQRAASLLQAAAVSQSRLDQANADLAVAEANANLARTRLDKTRIYAPFNGVIGLRKISPGDYVTVGQELANFESFDPMKVDFSIPEVYAPLLSKGQPLNISIDALPDASFTGTVYALDPQIDLNGRSVSLRATVPNPDNTLKPGYFARISLEVANKEAAMLVPEAAIIPEGNNAFVLKIGAESKVERVQVQTGVRQQGKVEITSGLNEGDIIITAGQMKAQPGMPVSPMIEGEMEPAANAAPVEAQSTP